MFGAIDDLRDNVYRFERLSDNCFCNPTVKGKGLFLTWHLHLSQKLAEFLQCEHGFCLTGFSQHHCNCRSFIAESQIVLTDIGGEYLSDLLHDGIDRLFTEFSQHSPAFAELHQHDGKWDPLL